MKKILITGVTGQLGSYAVDHAADIENMEVYGLIRTTTRNIPSYLDQRKLAVVSGDITDMSSISFLIKRLKPDYLINYAAFSQVGTSFNQPYNTQHTNIIGSLNILESIRLHSPDTKALFLGTSEMFGNAHDGDYSQSEETPLLPVSPYGTSKVAMYHLVRNYRQSYFLDVCSTMQFNAESPRRGEYFVTQKIAKFVKNYKPGQKLALGNLQASRDWSHAKDCVDAHFKMLFNGNNTEYCIGSGQTHTIGHFLDCAFGSVGINNWKDIVYTSQEFYRPNELHVLKCNPAKIKRELGWAPKHSFDDLVSEMVSKND